ncbi:potassium uptake protein, TrkH family [Micromonospora pattaloongensis]|uniref:Potassium uptake protein, TrkH family n=1 Tax=Micromonospora pattaloongensis TaxID=405436 RepID=A0A1H3MSV0_9ACTN|nr:potassium transporter TrkG [Micromonospora pattaloongensis]SDY79623.1 potassium uptake protein, TrkH family [Micromonospora pattaloongensis]
MRRLLQRPARIVPLAFLGAVVVSTLLMMLPAARAEPGRAPFVTALFTATSAVCVTGLNVVDTPTYWSTFGHVLITVLTQIGGFGIMAMATLLGLLVTQRLGLRSRLMAQAEQTNLQLGDVRRILGRVALTMLVFETAIAAVLAVRLATRYDYPIGRAVWEGVFHAVQAFNNAGFALHSDSLVQFVSDWWICVPITVGVIAGGLGFPVLFELARELRKPACWSTHTRLTVWGSVVLLVAGFVVMLAFEWSNPRTFGALDLPTKLLAALTQSAMPRSGGFNTVDYAAMNSETTAVTTALMFIGGGSGGTAGGIKVTTFFLLAYVIRAEIRGDPDVVVGNRRVGEATQRQAITVALLGIALVATGTLALIALTDGVSLERALFEVTSAFATVGLSMGLTPTLPPAAQLLLVLLMFIGRVGTIATGAALALNTQTRRYRYAEGRPIVG